MVGTHRYGWDKQLFGSIGKKSVAPEERVLFHEHMLELK